MQKAAKKKVHRPSRAHASNVTPLTKSSLVYADLRKQILSGALPPGKRLIIRRIAEKHDVSDIPVREALRLLEKDDLIRYMPFGSAFVREADDDEIYEIFFIRGLLEGAATQLAVNFVTEMTLRKLTLACEKMEQCARDKDIAEYAELNREFHRTIFSILPFTKLVHQIEGLWQSYGWLQLTFRLQPGRMAESNAEHRQIVDALRRGSSEDAGRAAFDHKQNARKAFIAARAPLSAGKSAKTAVKVSSVEGIEYLCDLWGETQWPAAKSAAAGKRAGSSLALANSMLRARGGRSKS